MSALAEEWCSKTGICSVLRKGDVSTIERLWKTEVTLAMHEHAKVVDVGGGKTKNFGFSPLILFLCTFKVPTAWGMRIVKAAYKVNQDT